MSWRNYKKLKTIINRKVRHNTKQILNTVSDYEDLDIITIDKVKRYSLNYAHTYDFDEIKLDRKMYNSRHKRKKNKRRKRNYRAYLTKIEYQKILNERSELSW